MQDSIYAQLPGILVPWYHSNKRELPWRRDRDPYHVWVSEIMLQQTRVEAVKGYYLRFLQTLPTIEDLARCDDDLLYKLWEGLGYYSRVRNLKKAAVMITEEFGGVFPETYTAVRKLPGIGPYTAGAICSICFYQPTPAVDGNVLRVCSRLTADFTNVDTPAYKEAVRQKLAAVYPADAGAFTQSLMELGATVCGPNGKPDCVNCPCNGFCEGYLQKVADRLPVKSQRIRPAGAEYTVLIVCAQGRYALRKRTGQGLLAGLWEFPNVPGHLEVEAALDTVTQWGLRPTRVHKILKRTHVFTHIRWNMQGIYISAAEPSGDFVWMTPEEITQSAALPTAFRQFWDAEAERD